MEFFQLQRGAIQVSGQVSGQAKPYFVLAFVRATLMVACILIGLKSDGLTGALAGQAAAYLLAYPAVVWLARRMGAWDALHDLVMAAVGLALASFALWLNWSSILTIVEI